MKDYQKGKIYKLFSVSNEDLIYYGSTIRTLNQRLQMHISECKNDKIRHCKSELVIAAGDYKIELIENYPCNSEVELNRREGEYTKANKCVNKLIAGRTRKEYYEDNKEYIKEYNKEYNKDNKEKIAEQKKEYYENNIEKRKEQMKAYGKVKITCECGCIIRKDVLARHKKSNKHLELMK